MQQLIARQSAGRYTMTPPPSFGSARVHRRNARGLGTTQGTTDVTAASGLLSASATLLTVSPATGPAAPFVAVAGAIVGLLAKIGIGAGCGQTCITATEYANQANTLLQQNIETYFSLPAPRTQSEQATAIANFNQVWQGLVSACATVPGTAGTDCITDRQAGACTWTQPAADVPPWGTPPAGACWNWFNGYLDPIQNDSPIIADPTTSTSTTSTAGSTASSVLSTVSTATGLSSSTLLLGGAALLILMALASGGRA